MSPRDDLRAALAHAERLLAASASARQARPDAETDVAALDAARLAVERAAAACETLTPALARRVQRVQASVQLQGRRPPARDLDGLFEAVRDGVAGDPWARAGMSQAFLDAPRVLARWRGAAMAACVLLAVGAFALGRTQGAGDDDTGRPLHDPRDELLERVDAPSTAAAALPHASYLQPASNASRAAPAVPSVGAGDRAPEPTRGVRRGFVTFHFGGSFRAGSSISFDEGVLLDGVDARWRLRLQPPAEPLRESN